MAKIDDDRELVHKLCDINSGLSEWELGFVESVAEQVLEDGRKLSPKQREKAEEVLAGQK